MAWARIDDQLFMHPKIRKAGPQATLLHIAALTYCNQQLTDGFIPEDVLPMIGMFAFLDPANAMANADRLLSTGLWDAVANGYQIHDYLQYNMSKEQITEMKEARKEAGKRGAASKNAKYSGNNGEYEPNSGKWSANAKQEPKQIVGKRSTISPTHPLPILNTTTTGGGGENSARISEVFTAYENNMGMITPITADQIKETISEFTNEWIMAAIGEAMKNNVRKWSYVEAVLDRWKVDGFQSKSARGQPAPANGKKRTTRDVAEEAMAEWEAEQKAKEQQI